MKLSLDALKDRAEATASMDLLATISGGTDNVCHDAAPAAPAPTVVAPAPPGGGTWEAYLNGTLGPNGSWGVGWGIKYKW
jgi:hypothetical protein